MANVQDLLAIKGTHVLSIGGVATVLDAALVMNEHKIGALVVIDQGRIVGMFTERDVLHRVVAERRDPATVRVADVMTRDVVCCVPETSVDEASTVMKERRIRHLPVCGPESQVIGMISIGDVNAFHAHSQERTIHHLNEYLYGRV